MIRPNVKYPRSNLRSPAVTLPALILLCLLATANAGVEQGVYQRTSIMAYQADLSLEHAYPDLSPFENSHLLEHDDLHAYFLNRRSKPSSSSLTSLDRSCPIRIHEGAAFRTRKNHSNKLSIIIFLQVHSNIQLPGYKVYGMC